MFPKLFFSLFKNQQWKNSLKKDIFHKLELLKLEQRITPAIKLNPVIQLPEHNLVIITQDLLSKVPQQELANATVVTLDPAQDVISQISNQLANRNGLDTIRIISHGKDGELVFGNQVVDQNILANRGSEIASWGKALALDADILLYGCSVAASESGKNFVTTLAGLTGADVAASTNPTGAGADTNLEYNAGLVTAGLQANQVAWNKSNLQLDQQDGPLYFTDDGTSVTITGYNGPGGAVNIPAVLNNLPVTTIGVNAFINKVSITSINIPNSVTTIGNSAFSGCGGLTSLTIPGSVITIGDQGFAGCGNLTSISIPASVIAIGNTAFANCWHVTTITFAANSSLTTIGQGAFFGCSSLTRITIPASVITISNNDVFLDCRSLTAIDVDAANLNYSSYFGVLYDKNQTTLITAPAGITSIVFPNTITTIGNNAFPQCRVLASITIPASVITIGNRAFVNSQSLTTINVDAANSNYSSNDGVLYNKDQSLLISCPGAKAGSLTVPGSVITIGDQAFEGCMNLTSINIPASVTTIGQQAFANCWHVTTITFAANSSLTTIGQGAFFGCNSFTSITIPASVVTISDNAFLACPSLVTISFQGNAPSISLNTFTSAGATRTIYYIATSSGWSNLFGGIPTICATSTNKLAIINNSLGAGDSSSITLFDPSTGLPIGVVVPFPGYIGEIRITSGDIDGDSVLDLIAGAGPGGGPAVVVINSVTGVVSQSFFAFDPNFRGGVFVAVRDINGDSILDIIVGAGAGGGPEVRIFDGRTNSILKSFFAYDASFRGGVSVATLDFNGDGIMDLVTGAGPGGAPHVKVFDGATGDIISQWYAYSLDFLGGVFVAAGDIGNDGRIEAITGPGFGSPPLVRVWDPFTATMLAQFYAYAEEFNGGVRVGISDGNFDGILDLITGAGEGGGPEVKGFSFPELDLLFSFFSGEPTNTTGVFVS
ncbi:MAG: DUF4347 domain-containing protein [Planctomycetota bacterium]|nr:MAG: DUF4347 domain-containing protein [Planctomycetota bacterium]